MAPIRVAILFVSLSTLLYTGCCGPMACAPTGNAPIAWGGSGCGQCDDCSGCGELYIDPWINHPPDACDPCDQCGNFNGQSCGQCRPVFGGVASLWGYRRDACDGGCRGGCDSCSTGGCAGSSCDGCSTCGVSDHHSAITFSREPTLAVESVVESSPQASSPFRPERTRKIYQPRNVSGRPPVAETY